MRRIASSFAALSAVATALAAASSALALVSCLRHSPDVKPSATLSPATASGGQEPDGAFAIAFAGPKGLVQDRAEPAITVLFNRAMRTLETPDDAGLPALRVETREGARVPGSLRWLGTHGLLFLPDEPLPGATSFAVTVPAGVRSLAGDAIGLAYRFELSTEPPHILHATPADDARDVRPNGVFELVFNENVDPAAVAKAAALHVGTKKVAVHGTRPQAAPDGVPMEHVAVIASDEPMAIDSAIALTIAPAFTGAEGPAPMGAPYTLRARTYGPLRLADVRCPKVDMGRCQAHRDVTVVLSNAVDPSELRAHVRTTIPRASPPAPTSSTPPPPRPVPHTSHALGVDPREGRRYRVTLTAGMHDVFGQVLAKDVSVEVDIEAAYARPAHAPAHAPGGSAPAPAPPPPNDSRPTRPVLDYQAEIGVRGQLLEARAAPRGAGHRLPIGIVNLPTYGLAAAALQQEEALRWLSNASVQDGPSGGGFRWDWVSPGVPENVRSVRTLDLDALLATTAGSRVALVALAIPGTSETAARTQMLDITDLGVTAKMSRYGSLVWVTRLSTGEPVADAKVMVRKEQHEVFTGATDTSGVATISAAAYKPVSDRGAIDGSSWIFVQKDDDWVYQRMEASRASMRAGPDVDLAQRGEWQGFVFTDRGVYRPGDTMRVSAIVRRSDAAGSRVPDATDVRVDVKDAQDERVFSGHGRTDAFGEVAVDVPLPRTSHLGPAAVSLHVGRSEDDAFGAGVTLAAFKPSEFQVDIDPAKPAYIRGETAEFSVAGNYLYGAPMDGASFHSAASRSRTAFAPPGSNGYVTTDDAFMSEYPDVSPRSSALSVDDGELDAKGRAKRSIALDMPGQVGPEIVVFEAEVADKTRQTVAQHGSVLVHPAPFYVALKEPASSFVAVGAPVKAEVVAFDPDGTHRAGVATRVELVARTWSEATTDEAADVPRRGTKVVDTVVATCDTRTTATVAGCTVRVPSAGYFILRATSAGPVVHASTSLYGVGDRADSAPPVAWSDDGARGLSIDADKPSYASGDTAKILVRSPFQEADALVTVERAGVLWRNVVHVRGAMPVIDVPIDGRYYPNVFVGVHLVRGRVAAEPAPGEADLGAPDFRTAYKEIAIDAETHRLRVGVTPVKEQYRPGETVDADVNVRDADGRGVKAAVTFYAVDEGALMLTGYKTPDPLPAFAARKRLATFGVENREHLAHFVAMKDGERVPYLAYEYERKAGDDNAADKGDDGGGGGAAGEEALRSEFRTTAYFEPSRVTSDEGKAHFQFKLPDNLTRFRLMAVVASQDDKFGYGESAIASSRKLMVRPATPRALRVGDTFTASAVISSKGIDPVSASVSLDAKGVELTGPRTASVLVPRGGQVEVRFPARATREGSADFTFGVTGGGFTDRVLVHSAVTLPVVARTAAVYGQASNDFAVAIGDLSRVRPDRGALDVRLSTSALVGIDGAFDQLFQYPYGCTEQLTSRTIPLLSLTDMARAFHVRVPAQSHDAVDDAVGAILRHQHGDGGFGYWDDDPPVPWLSAYAMWALEAASKQGYYVPPGDLDKGVEYLRAALAKQARKNGAAADEGSAPGAENTAESTADPDAPPAAESDDRETDASPERELDATSRAFIADVLAMVGAADPAVLNTAYEAREHVPLAARALLLHAMATAHVRPLELHTLTREIEQRLRVSANEALAGDDGADEEISEPGESDIGSPGRTTALALRALLAADPKHPLAPRLARGLLGLRREGAWRSTQENLWALVALEEYRKAQEARAADVDVQAFLGNEPIGSFAFHAGQIEADPLSVPMQHVAPYSKGQLSFDVKGQGTLFYAAKLESASTDLPQKPEDHGFFVQRLMHVPEPDELRAADPPLPKTSSLRAAAGDLVVVDLLVESAEPRDQVVIDDPLAGGLEAVSFDLETSSKLETVDDVGTERVSRHRGLGGYGSAFALPDQVHREVHDDRVLTFARHLDPGMYHFRYLVRATTLGHFVVPPAEIHCMYAPEASGRTSASTFDVIDRAGRVAQR
jgi:uncharacterized protein YfaS (alpha-2-macroglobulin family)